MASVIGVDAHKATLSCSAVDELGREVDSIRAANDGRGFARVGRFALRVGATRVGIECSGSYGLALAQHLIAAGWDVKEVPGQLVKQIRRANAMRCLKRHLARVVYRRLVADQTLIVLT